MPIALLHADASQLHPVALSDTLASLAETGPPGSLDDEDAGSAGAAGAATAYLAAGENGHSASDPIQRVLKQYRDHMNMLSSLKDRALGGLEEGYSGRPERRGHYERMVAAMDACARDLKVEVRGGPTGVLYVAVVSARFCGRPICPICQDRKRRRDVAKYRPKVLWALEDKGVPFLLTATRRPIPIDALRDEVSAMRRAITKLHRTRRFPKDTLVRLEIAWRKPADGHRVLTPEERRILPAIEMPAISRGHVLLHAHWLALMRPSEVKAFRDFDFAGRWQRALGLDYEPIVEAKQVRRNDALAVLNYVAKPTPLSLELDEIYESEFHLQGLRMREPYGMFRRPAPSPEPEPLEPGHTCVRRARLAYDGTGYEIEA